MNADEVLDFWYSEEVRPRWFRSDNEFDTLIRQRFETAWQQGRDGRLNTWEESARGALALVILFDQFPLNMYRGQALSFSTEAASRKFAERAIARGFDQTLSAVEKAFLYMPYMHSENPADQDRSVALYGAAGLADNLRFAEHHRDIVRRFGRFPHRNAALERQSTPEELEWLASPEAFKG